MRASLLSITRLFWILFCGMATLGLSAQASESCGVIENVEGVVEVLSPDRRVLYPVHERRDLDCQAWISTSQGWIRWRHKNGAQIQVGPETFLRIEHGNAHVVLFKGILFARSFKGNGELMISTTNSLARLKNASAILTYQEEDSFSLLTAVEGSPSLENQFADQARITLKPGESTTFHANLKRVFPSTPRAVSVALLKPKLDALHVEEGVIERATRSAHKRITRRYASTLGAHDQEPRVSDYTRGPASLHRHSEEDAYLSRRWKEKIRIFENKRKELLREISSVRVDE